MDTKGVLTMNLIPYVVEQSSRGERTYDIYSRLLQDRILFVSGEITDAVANTVIAQLSIWMPRIQKKDIHMYINSPGGSITAGMGIYDAMHLVKADVSTLCVGMAASMGAFYYPVVQRETFRASKQRNHDSPTAWRSTGPSDGYCH